MALIGELKPFLNEIARYLRIISNAQCTNSSTSAGENTSIPANFKSVAIIKTNSTGTVDIEMSDGSVYTLTEEGEGITDEAGSLPAYNISTSDGGEWKWHGIN